MIHIVKESVDVIAGLEKAKREILAIRRQLVQDGKVSNHLGISFTVVDDTAAKKRIEQKRYVLRKALPQKRKSPL